ncbi:aconitase X swivel domain-containing protein [Emcibacter nanhaiensis]|uniref:DUF126 domain-containing protein n=1 Tax=Emcibacter nanhaiensis TaxID=1505037 RepID=A0A501PI91_9PROT|nr:DUF126 domain-containing protein [Emcibacter nanhaiensis]TPD60203.1 DUF126 domain-containing protein [Emcibacter nanhaiensis]
MTAVGKKSMNSPIVIRGRGVVPGVAEGKAMVTKETISGWGGISPMEGKIIETRHELVGQCFANKILLFRGAKGSSGWSAMFHMAKLAGVAPAAMLFTDMTAKAALGAVVMHVPTVTDFEEDPYSFIETGDHVRVNGSDGLVEIWKKPPADLPE